LKTHAAGMGCREHDSADYTEKIYTYIATGKIMVVIKNQTGHVEIVTQMV
jgi:hypothetical protein